MSETIKSTFENCSEHFALNRIQPRMRFGILKANITKLIDKERFLPLSLDYESKESHCFFYHGPAVEQVPRPLQN